MRFSKIMLVSAISIIILCIALFISYHARLSIINYLVEQQLKFDEQLSSQQVKITCLDFDITKNLFIVVKQLCIKSPKANIEIDNTQIEWQFSPKLAITNVDVSLIKVIGTEHLLTKTQDSTASENKKLSQLFSNTFSLYAEKIAQFTLPLTFNIHQLAYYPFTVEKQKTPYIARLSGKDNTVKISLSTPNKIAFINTRLTTENKGFTLTLLSNLQLLKDFVTLHQLPITNEQLHNLKELTVSGNLETAINYQTKNPNSKSIITAQNQLTNFTLSSANGINKSGPFTLSSSLNFQTKLNLTQQAPNSNDALIEINLLPNNQVKNNEITLDHSLKHLLIFLKEGKILAQENKVFGDIIALLNDNPTNRLILDLNNQDNSKDLNKSNQQSTNNKESTISVYDNQISLNAAQINISAQHNVNSNLLSKKNKLVHQVKLNGVLFTYPITKASNVKYSTETKSKNSPETLAIKHFTMNSKINIAKLATFTNAPVNINLSGSLYKTEQKIDLKLDNNSVISAKKFTFATQNKQIKTPSAQHRKNRVKNKQEKQPSLALSTLTTKLAGHVQLLKNNAIELDIKIHNQAEQLSIPNTLQIKSFEVMSNIKGNVDNILVNTSLKTDGVNIGNINVTGPLLSPTVQMSIQSLLLTDLLALHIKLPISVELIDGKLDYNIMGNIADLTNISNIKSTPFNATVSITSVSGEFDDIWLQELNWQQSFTLLNGEITTQPNNTANKNLTVALIDTPTPVSEISLNTNWTYSKNFALSLSQLKGQVLGGSYALPKIQWPFKNGHSVNIQLSSIDLEQVVALDKKQGIVVTGQISGQLPLTYNDGKYTIENGELHNDSDGLIQVFDNPAIAELAASNSELQVAFDALQNLHYHQLSSDVSMQDDGYMVLDTVIKGNNPDIDNDVNLNLNLTYDLLGLLKSISITERFEQEIIKGIQTH